MAHHCRCCLSRGLLGPGGSLGCLEPSQCQHMGLSRLISSLPRAYQHLSYVSTPFPESRRSFFFFLPRIIKKIKNSKKRRWVKDHCRGVAALCLCIRHKETGESGSHHSHDWLRADVPGECRSNWAVYKLSPIEISCKANKQVKRKSKRNISRGS